MVTTGVVILTLRLTSEYNVVAEDPMLILAISPIASRSISVSASPLDAGAAPTVAAGASSDDPAGSSFEALLLLSDKSIPLSSALISSCVNIPSMPYSPSLITDVIRTAYLS